MTIYHFNIYDRQNMLMYVEMEKLSRNRWACSVDYDEFTIRTKETEPLAVLQVLLEKYKEYNS